jgi:hypothetical protein
MVEDHEAGMDIQQPQTQADVDAETLVSGDTHRHPDFGGE